MRILVIANTPPRDDSSTMGIQQTYHRLRKLTGEHQFTIAYTNQEQLPEPQAGSDIPFELVRLPNPHRAPRMAQESRPRVYWQIRAWRQALFAPEPQIYREHHDPALEHTIAQMIHQSKPDIVHVIGENMLMNTPRDCAHLLADFPDMFSILFARVNAPAARRTHQWQHAREVEKMRGVERTMLRRAAAALFVSETDRAVARAIEPAAKTFVVPNAVDLDFFRDTQREDENLVLFTGTLSYAPNIEALKFFVGEIFPYVVKAHPQAKLDIVGYNPAPTIAAMRNESIRVFANVPDVRPYLSRAAVCIAPILSGSGTRIKIIEAWAMHKAVVSTSIGAEGLEAQHNVHLLLGNEPRAFAAAVTELLQDSARRRAIGKAGYQLAAEKYSMARAAQELNRVYQTIR